MTEEQQALHPLYKPAEVDTKITINFIGNTPVISGYDATGITPYHMLAASEDLKRKAFQMIQLAEIKEAEERNKREAMSGIQVPGKTDLSKGGFEVGG